MLRQPAPPDRSAGARKHERKKGVRKAGGIPAAGSTMRHASVTTTGKDRHAPRRSRDRRSDLAQVQGGGEDGGGHGNRRIRSADASRARNTGERNRGSGTQGGRGTAAEPGSRAGGQDPGAVIAVIIALIRGIAGALQGHCRRTCEITRPNQVNVASTSRPWQSLGAGLVKEMTM